MTNFERIRNMSIDELARFLATLEYEFATGNYDAEYDDEKNFDDIIKYSYKPNPRDDASRFIRLLNREG